MTEQETGMEIRRLSDELKAYKIYKLWRKRYGTKTNLGSREQLAIDKLKELPEGLVD